MRDTSTLWQAGACELAARIAAGEVSATDSVEAAIGRVRSRNPALNAVVDDLGDAALHRAGELDRHFARDGVIGPLHGVPVTIKENIDQTGRPTPNGVVAYKDLIAPGDSPFVRNMERAGAVVIGRTNTPEFSFRATTDNELHGRTFNPWNDWASAGGSSGGAASAVMSGMCTIAHGNDIGGSLRYPAAAVGAATVKPGLGRTPAYNPSAPGERGLLAQLMSVQGVICREVRDVRLAMQAAIAYDPHDPWMVPMPWNGPPEASPIKVAFTRDGLGHDLDPAVETALLQARDALSDAGYQVVETEPPLVAEAAAEGSRCLFGEIRLMFEGEIRKHGSETINRIFDHYFDYFGSYDGDDLIRAMARRSHYVRQWNLFLADWPLVLTPFLPMPTYEWDRDAKGREGVETLLGAGAWSIAMNFMGLPAGNVPANYNDGLPVGVQLVGRRFREDMILDACAAIEGRVGLMANHLFARE